MIETIIWAFISEIFETCLSLFRKKSNHFKLRYTALALILSNITIFTLLRYDLLDDIIGGYCLYLSLVANFVLLIILTVIRLRERERV